MKLRIIAIIVILLAAKNAFSESPSCYTGELSAHRPPLVETIVALIDTSSEAASTQQKLLDAIKTVTEKNGRHIVVLSYAGNAAGESLKVEFEGIVEPILVNPQIIDNTVIKVFKNHQKCIREQHIQTQMGTLAALQRVLSAMPVSTSRSEIAYALSSTIQAYMQLGRNLVILHLSDGLQHAQSGRSFYGLKMQPRRLDPVIEMRYFAKDRATAPRIKTQGPYVSLLWWGMLSIPNTNRANEKPIYLDTATISSFETFWDIYARSLGVDRIQLGTPNLLNPDLSTPIKLPK